VDVPVELAPQGVISDPEQVIGRITKVQLVAGEMVMDHNLADPTNVSRDLGFVIGDNQVLMAFPAQDLMSTLNVLQRGDLIDIFVSLSAPAPQASPEPGGATAEEVQPLTGSITFDAFQRLEITAMVIDVVQEQQRSVPEVPAGGTPQPQPTPKPSEVKVRAYLLALAPQDALTLKHLKDNGATFDFVLRAPTSTQLFELQTVTSDYLIDRYELAIPK
jgi:hypothetical protein